MAKVLDLKVFKPEERIFRLLDEDGKEIKSVNVSRVPTDAVISILDNMDVLVGIQNGNVDSRAYDVLLDVVVRTCEANDNEVTKEYLLAQLDVFGLTELIMYIIEPVMEQMRSQGQSKKK